MSHIKNIIFTMRVSKPLRNKITISAKSLNMTDSEYVINAISNTKLNYKPIRKDLAKVSLGIKKVGNNLNQIAHVLNIANKENTLGDIEYDKMLDILLDIKLSIKDIGNECH